VEVRNIYSIFVRILEGKGLFGGTACRFEQKIEMNFVDSIYMISSCGLDSNDSE
jgi:hypothetical protein